MEKRKARSAPTKPVLRPNQFSSQRRPSCTWSNRRPVAGAITGQSKASFVHSDQESAARGIDKVDRAQIYLHTSTAQSLERFAPALLHVFHPGANQLSFQPKDDCVFPLVDRDAQHGVSKGARCHRTSPSKATLPPRWLAQSALYGANRQKKLASKWVMRRPGAPRRRFGSQLNPESPPLA